MFFQLAELGLVGGNIESGPHKDLEINLQRIELQKLRGVATLIYFLNKHLLSVCFALRLRN